MQVFFTAAKLLIIAAIFVSGFVLMSQGNTENLTEAFKGSETSFSAIAVAFYSGLWSYDGWFVKIIYINSSSFNWTNWNLSAIYVWNLSTIEKI